jgi:hypothetical protein
MVQLMTDIEKALNDGKAPWKNIEYRTKDFWIFGLEDTSTHLLFVPTQTNADCLAACWRAAYQWGYQGLESNTWTGFQVWQNVGSSDPDGTYPAVHMQSHRVDAG